MELNKLTQDMSLNNLLINRNSATIEQILGLTDSHSQTRTRKLALANSHTHTRTTHPSFTICTSFQKRMCNQT